MAIKSTPFRTVKLVKTIELKTDAEIIIDRLRSMERICYRTDKNGGYLAFYCDKKGRIDIIGARGSTPDTKSLDVTGRIVSRDGKSVLNIYSIQHRSNPALMWITAIGYTLVVAFLIALLIFKSLAFTIEEVFVLIAGLGLVIGGSVACRNNPKNADANLQIEIEEIERRVMSADRWDDLKPLDFD